MQALRGVTATSMVSREVALAWGRLEVEAVGGRSTERTGTEEKDPCSGELEGGQDFKRHMEEEGKVLEGLMLDLVGGEVTEAMFSEAALGKLGMGMIVRDNLSRKWRDRSTTRRRDQKVRLWQLRGTRERMGRRQTW